MVTTMTLEEWKAKGTALFGENVLAWKFVCPVCGHVQTPADFEPHQIKGASPASAYQECIGRYTGVGEFREKGQGPCNYAGYGLFKLSPVRITIDAEAGPKEFHAFAFAEEPAVASEPPATREDPKCG